MNKHVWAVGTIVSIFMGLFLMTLMNMAEAASECESKWLTENQVVCQDVRNYFAYVHHIVDGDTFDVTIDMGMQLKMNVRVRFFEYDAPEADGRAENEQEKILGSWATERLQELIEGKTVLLVARKPPKFRGSFGRMLADVYLPGGRNIATIMTDEGFIKPEK